MEPAETNYLNHDFRTCLYRLMTYGSEVHPRGTVTRELLNYNITLRNPRNRIVTFKERNTSLRYLLGEFIWYLSASASPAGILPYASFWGGIVNGGDHDGYPAGTVNSNYGTRLFGDAGAPAAFSDKGGARISQWRETIELLSRDKETRQAVNNIHVPSDRHIDNRDVPCLAGETVLLSPEKSITIKELAERFQAGLTSYPLYSWNEETQETRVESCLAAWKTGRKKALRLTFDDGSSAALTHDHLVWRYRRSDQAAPPRVRAGELRAGDELCSSPALVGHDKKMITRVEEVGEIDVYDFTTPINHSCVLDNGLVVHNCTLSLQWFIRQNRLHLITNMRSNDQVLGLTNDIFQFTMLQECMMHELRGEYPELELGFYYHNAGSMHIYSRHFEMARAILRSESDEECIMPSMDAWNEEIREALVSLKRRWEEAGMDEGFDFTGLGEWKWLTPYWQDLVRLCFGRQVHLLQPWLTRPVGQAG